MNPPALQAHRQDLDKVLRVIQDTPTIDREHLAPVEEFQARVRRTNEALQKHGHTVGLVFTDDHYASVTRYLGGDITIFIERLAPMSWRNGLQGSTGLLDRPVVT